MIPLTTLFLTLAFGSEAAILTTRATRGIDVLCPCTSDDEACVQTHRLAGRVVGSVAADDEDPEEAVAVLDGLLAHETCARTMVEVGGGAARSWWQLEPTAWTAPGRAEQTATWLADPKEAAREALRRARTCGGSMMAYAGGTCSSRGPVHARVAEELRRYVTSARYFTR
jgi:hypothetical protein